MKRKIRMLASLVLTLALAMGLALPAGAAGGDGYVVVTTPEQLAAALENQSVGKIRLGNDIYSNGASVTAVHRPGRNLTLDLGGYTWDAKVPNDSSALLGITEDVSVSVCNGYITFGGGDRTVIWQTAGELTLEGVTMNGGIMSTAVIREIRGCNISSTAQGDNGVLTLGSADMAAELGNIGKTVISGVNTGVWLVNGTIGTIWESEITVQKNPGAASLRVGGNGTVGKVDNISRCTLTGSVANGENCGIDNWLDNVLDGNIFSLGTIGSIYVGPGHMLNGLYDLTVTKGIVIDGSVEEISDCVIGGTLHVRAGTVDLIKNCTIKAENDDGNYCGAITVGTDDAENPGVGSVGDITGCMLTGLGSEVNGISLFNGVISGTISGCTITASPGGYGIMRSGCNLGTINAVENSTITGDEGIHYWGGYIYSLRNCIIAGRTGAGVAIYADEIGTITGNTITSQSDYAIYVGDGGITRLEDNRLTGNPADGSGVDVYNAAGGTIQTVYAAGTLNGNVFTASSGWTLLNEGTVGEYRTPPDGGSGGGGSGGSPAPAPGVTENADGSKTETVTDEKTGAVTETTTWPDGSKTVAVTRKDGSKTEEITRADGTKAIAETDVNGKVVAAVTLPAAAEGRTVLPLSKLPVAKAAGDASLVTVQTDKPVTVVIPVENTGAGTVAVLVREDGTEEIIKTSVAGADGLVVALDGTATIKILDNSKAFADMSPDNWASEAVDFVTSRELFQGTGADAFSPALPMNRAMLVTVLYRLENEPEAGAAGFDDVAQDAWYGGAVAWASSSGIVTGTGSGFDPDGLMTRESLAVMLYRYAKPEAAAGGSLEGYPDSGDVSGWAAEAMEWAVQSGILSGKSGGGLDPQGQASRAEVATMLMRLIAGRNA